MFKCLLGCRWKEWKRQTIEDISFGEPGILRTDFYLECERCGKEKKISMDGDFRKIRKI